MQYLVDTHILVGRLLKPSRLPKRIRQIFSDKNQEFLIPTMVLLEMQYLNEIGRVEVAMDDVLKAVQEESQFQIVSFDETALLHAVRLIGTRDPFDRVILSHALSTSTKILTKDHWMKQTAPHLVIDS